jgi:hypothetical protein
VNEQDKRSADASFFFFYFISIPFVLWLFSTSMRFNFLEMSKKLNDLKPTAAHVPKVLLCPNATGEEVMYSLTVLFICYVHTQLKI